MSTQEYLGFEAAQSVRRIPFKTAKVVPGIVSGTHILIVSGETACVNMKVRLSPLIYIRCPEYWGIEVLGAKQAQRINVAGGCKSTAAFQADLVQR